MKEEEINYNITGDNKIKKIFKIPVGKLSSKEAHEAVEKLMEELSQNKYDDDVYIPVREEKINLGYGDYWFPTKDDNWYQKDKAKETDPQRDKNDIVLDSGVVFADWNKFSMDELADYLEKKHMFLSDSESFAINRLIDFYRENKNK